MKNQKGISLIKLVIIIVIVVALFFLISKIILKSEEEEAKKLEQSRLVARQESICNIGDKITADKFEITVTNIEERTKVGVSKYYSTVDDYYYILICSTIQIKNISSEPKRIYDYVPDFSRYFKIEDFDEKHKYYNNPEYTVHYQYEFNNFDVTQLTIKPGETVTVSPVFKVDKNIYQNKTFYLNILGGTALVKTK